MKADFENYKSKYYMAWAFEQEIIENSSSGGIFTILARYVLSRGGVVFGVFQDPDTLELFQRAVFDLEDIDILRRSKYYQSNALSSYPLVKKYLEEGRWTLYSGTACQIAALYQYLQESDIHRLITVDVLCHGVSSIKAVQAYIQSKEKQFKKKTSKTEFRTKKVRWSSGGGTSMRLEFEDGTEKIIPNDTDTFFVAFNNNLILRESCYSCRFAGEKRIADFTLADFWGIEQGMVPEEQLDKGVGLVLVNSPKAERIWKELSLTIYQRKADPQFAISHNCALSKPQDRPPARSDFYKYLEQKDFDVLVKKIFRRLYIKVQLKRLAGPKVVRIVKRIMKLT